MRGLRWLIAVALLATAGFDPGHALAEPRVALVIGNSAYGPTIGDLPNPANDARLMEKTLKKLGFDVVSAIDADQNDMKRAVGKFGQKLTDAGEDATGLFFYAGHGLQVGGENFLIPIHAEIARENDVDIEAVPASLILKQMEYAGSRVNIVILDACRNNPLARSFRSVSRGLAEPKVKPRGSFIAYSTAPGDVASDGAGNNSPYTEALAAAMSTPGAGIEEVFRDVRSRVITATDNAQIPWDSSSLTAPFYFIEPSANGGNIASSTTPAQTVGIDPKMVEMTFWTSIQTSTDAADFEAYLDKYPEGDFAMLAKNRMRALGGTSGSAAPVVDTTAALDTGAADAGAGPAADPASFQPADTELTTKAKALVREAPDRNARVLVRLKAGMVLAATGRSPDNSWWRIQLTDGRVGFIHKDAVEGAEGIEASTGGTPPAPIAGFADSAAALTACKINKDPAAQRRDACRAALDLGGLDTGDQHYAYNELGRAYYDLNELDDAAAAYQRAIDLDSQDAAPLFNIGLIQANWGQYDAARASFDKSAQLDPKDSTAIYQRGKASSYGGDFAQALLDFDKAIAMDGTATDYLNERAYARMATGDAGGAIADIEAAKRIDSTYWAITGVVAYQVGGNYEQALAMAEEMTKGSPDYAYGWVWKAIALRALYRQDEAMAALKIGKTKLADQKAWPAPLFEWMMGERSADKLRAAAKVGNEKLQRQQLCEFYFYVGQATLAAGDKITARRMLEQASQTKVFDYLEYVAAVGLLKQL